MRRIIILLVSLLLLVSISFAGEKQSGGFIKKAKQKLKKCSTEEETKKYLKSLGPEKVYLLAIELANEGDLESPAWILAYGGLSDWKINAESFLRSYLYLNKYENITPKEFKKWGKESVESFIKEEIGKGGMNFEQEKCAINEGIKFLNTPTHSPEEKKIIMQFLWDVWSGFFFKANKMGKKKEMNQQAIQIMDILKTYVKDPDLDSHASSTLEKFRFRQRQLK